MISFEIKLISWAWKNHDNPNRVCSLWLCCSLSFHWSQLELVTLHTDWDWLFYPHLHLFHATYTFNTHFVCLPIQLYFNLTLFNILALLMIYSRISNQFFFVGDGFFMCDRNYWIVDACYSIHSKSVLHTVVKMWVCISNANEF